LVSSMFEKRSILCLFGISLLILLMAGCVEKSIQSGQQQEVPAIQQVVQQPAGPENTPIQTETPAKAADSTGSAGNIFYVSVSGDDSNPGTQESPWKTPGFGSRQLKPGDTLIVQPGTYKVSRFDDDIIIPESGTKDKWVTISGDAKNPPVLAGSDNLLTAIDLANKEYIQIENIVIQSDNGASLRDGLEIMNGPASHIVLKNLDINHVDEFGINIGDVDDLQILDSKITYAGFGSVGGPAGEHGGWRNAVIRNCYFAYAGHYYQGGPGPSPYDRPDGFGIEASNGPIEIANTIVEHNRGDGLDSKAANTYIHDSTVKDNSCDGVKMWGAGSRLEDTTISGRGDGNTEATPWADIVIDSEKSGAEFQISRVSIEDTVGNNYIMHAQYDRPDVPVKITVKDSSFRGLGPNSPIFVGRASTITFQNTQFYLPQTDFILEKGDERIDKSMLDSLGENNSYG
jgi:hypothetical protein